MAALGWQVQKPLRAKSGHFMSFRSLRSQILTAGADVSNWVTSAALATVAAVSLYRAMRKRNWSRVSLGPNGGHLSRAARAARAWGSKVHCSDLQCTW